MGKKPRLASQEQRTPNCNNVEMIEGTLGPRLSNCYASFVENHKETPRLKLLYKALLSPLYPLNGEGGENAFGKVKNQLGDESLRTGNGIVLYDC